MVIYCGYTRIYRTVSHMCRPFGSSLKTCLDTDLVVLFQVTQTRTGSSRFRSSGRRKRQPLSHLNRWKPRSHISVSTAFPFCRLSCYLLPIFYRDDPEQEKIFWFSPCISTYFAVVLPFPWFWIRRNRRLFVCSSICHKKC